MIIKWDFLHVHNWATKNKNQIQNFKKLLMVLMTSHWSENVQEQEKGKMHCCATIYLLLKVSC